MIKRLLPMFMFGGLCVLSASEWLFTPASETVLSGAYALVALVAAVANGRRAWGSLHSGARLGAAAALALGIPTVMVCWAGGHVSGSLGTAVFAAVPVMVVLFTSQGNVDDSNDPRRLLLPSVAGLGGLLLLIPLSLPASLAGVMALLAVVAAATLVAVASVWIRRLLQGYDLIQSIAIFALSNAAVLLCAGTLSGWNAGGVRADIWVAGLIAGAEAVLLVGLLRGMLPVQVAARFLAIPLLTVMEGYFVLRPEITLRMGMGAALLVGGVGFVLFSPEGKEVPSLIPR